MALNKISDNNVINPLTLNTLRVDGTFTSSGTAIFSAGTLSTISTIIRLTSGQTSDLLQMQSTSGTAISGIDAVGSVFTPAIMGMDRSNAILLGSNRNVGLNAGSANYGGGSAVTFIGNAAVAPSSNPTGGGIIYVDSGSLRYRGTSGSNAIIVNADGTAPILNSGSGTYENYNADSTIRAEFRGTAGTQRPYIELQGVGANDPANENGGAFIRFRTSRSAGYGADIGAIRKPTGASQLIFKTGTAVADAITQKMVIDENGNVLINGFASGTTGLTVRGASGQSVNLYEIQDNSSVLLGGMTPAGRLYVQRQEGIQFMDGVATLRSRIYSSGNNGMYFDTGGGAVRVLTLDGGSESITGNLFYPYSSGRIGLIVRGLSGQSVNLQEWQNNTPTTVASVSTTGVLTTAGLTLSSTTSPITLNGSAGTSGLVLTSAGAGATPTWTNPNLVNVNTTAKSAAYTLGVSDLNTLVQMSGAFAFTVDTNLYNTAVGTQITLLALTSGVTVVASGAGVVVNATPGLKLRAQYSVATLICLASGPSACTWLLTGDLSA